ncbi:hypothetical protein DMH02_026750 [Streptomyces sp. WAC 00631]|uniref:hypothetical protein n=1 Tax=unclassified Streptomyces TaxID=2593676 RepID=UPI000F7A3B8F|nr:MULTISPECIES: hypothetical protein [unclassified Streptomyces]MCC5036671.1 hypothetical protein [Streptomyces sp. WAC 00631]MCC9738187.1 hypothetical protein [Streptomyces sp. MNU89]
MRPSGGGSRRSSLGRRPAGVLSALFAVLAVLLGGPPLSSPAGSADPPAYTGPADHSAAVTERVAVPGILSSGRAAAAVGDDHQRHHTGMPAAVPVRHAGQATVRHRAPAAAPRPATGTAHHTPRSGRAPPGPGALRGR